MFTTVLIVFAILFFVSFHVTQEKALKDFRDELDRVFPRDTDNTEGR